MLIELGPCDVRLAANMALVDPPSVRMKPHMDFEGKGISKGFITGLALKCHRLAVVPLAMT